MQIRMMYQPSSVDTPVAVDVYHIYTTPELECYATGWVVENGYWITVPIYTLTPVGTKKKELLNEHM